VCAEMLVQTVLPCEVRTPAIVFNPCALHRRSNICRYCTREESALPQAFDYFSRTCVKAFPLFPFPLRSVPFPVKSPHGYPLIIFIFESKQMRTDELGPL
jgi:hypothetical protein